MPLCSICGTEKAQLRRHETKQLVCKKCFSFAFEEEVFQTIQRFNLLKPGDIVAIGASGGKDSTVLVHVLYTLNQRHNLGIDIRLVTIDEGIQGYRNYALQTVKDNAASYGLPLLILPFTELFGWSLDQIFSATQTKETCTYCGIFRRRALDIGAARVNATKVAVGHNADDISETVLLNMMRGDSARFGRSVDIITNGIETHLAESRIAPRIKPFALQNQVEIVWYAHFNALKYYAVECPYAVQAFRRFPREYLVSKQKTDPGVMRRIIEGSLRYQDKKETEDVAMGLCSKCGSPCNNKVCMACHLLQKLADAHAQKAVVPDPPNAEDTEKP